MASEQMEAIKAMMRNMPKPDTPPTVEQQRAGMEATANFPVPAGVTITDLDVAGRPARLYQPDGGKEDRGILYLHGGGYVIGSLNTHNALMARLAKACGAQVLGLDYRLAPENPYPAAVEDAVAGYDFARQQVAHGRIVIAGDSAGGGLTLATLLTLEEQGKPMPGGAVLLSPWTDLTASGDSIKTRADADPMIPPDALVSMAAHYHADQDPATPGISPLFGDLAGLPQMLIQVGDAEVLLDDATRLHQRALASGVSSELRIFDGAFHVFQAFPDLPESEAALNDISDFFGKAAG